jgi:hypothetical protein
MVWLAYRAWCRGILWRPLFVALLAEPLHRELTETLCDVTYVDHK